jgi:hypothetical protein
MALVHHELCFGCGWSNLFGLHLELEATGEGAAAGRWFVKQDHQGPHTGRAHPGVLACALVEAVLLAGGGGFDLSRAELELEVDGRAAVGSFCEIEAAVTDGKASAMASSDGLPVARLFCECAPREASS